ncbi:hypothetical protein T10_11015 [Trichinella papuae]|uniref:Uncharacterized protein n=1 Tax=Trichinella papuae TaxID=268474 RepID=A0A0V1MD62_9BILA|nr:hypothetical protein T10_11015 [Trichinella papuae]
MNTDFKSSIHSLINNHAGNCPQILLIGQAETEWYTELQNTDSQLTHSGPPIERFPIGRKHVRKYYDYSTVTANSICIIN